MLEQAGYRVLKARDGSEALRVASRNPPDLTLSDILMPVIDGNGVVAHIRKSEKQSIPVLAISGTPWLLESANFDMVLSKPFPLKKLIESIRSLASMPTRAAVGA